MIEFPLNFQNYIVSESDFNRFCNQIIATSPQDIEVLAATFYNIGNDSSREKNYEMAIKLYEKSLEYIDNEPSVYKNMGSRFYDRFEWSTIQASGLAGGY